MESIRIYLISNMYPSVESPNFGVFVRNFEQDFPSEKLVFVDKTVIEGKKSGFSLWIAYLLFFVEVVKKLHRGDFDAVYVHYLQHSLIPFHFWRNRTGKKLILNAHGTDILGKGKLYEGMRKWNQSVFDRADLVIVPSFYFIEKLTQLGVNPDKLEVYPSGGINPEVFFPAEEKASPEYRLGYLGRIDSGKGVDTLIRAFSKLPLANIALEICGPGSQREEMERLAQTLGVNQRVRFLGNIPQEKIREIFLRWDALVFPSELEESLGLVGLEAMSCGLPVIGTGAGGMSTYLISSENGIVFEPGNVNQLVEKISDFYRQDQAFRNRLAKKAIGTASRYHSNRVNSALRNRIQALFSA